MSDIAVVIVNWNKKDDVIELLRQLASIPETVDIYVVDNASTDDSVETIRQAYPNVELLVNKQNLGGTGGFNTGLNHVCNNGRYTYVWLLDNDARIKADALSELLKTMDSDPSIGLVGSRIVDIDNEDITIETGGTFRWDAIGVEPINRNTRGMHDEVIQSDYVAICSALIRCSTLKKVGLMDDRLFIFWDDMDWGLYFKESGYQVVCASKSVVMHGSFTERERGKPTNFYYSLRNSFLVYSKHSELIKAVVVFNRSIRNWFRTYVFFLFHKRHEEKGLIRKAFLDFMNNRWGKLDTANIPEFKHAEGKTDKALSMPDIKLNAILVSVIGLNYEASRNLLDFVHTHYANTKITVLIRDDRVEYFKEYDQIKLTREVTRNVRYICSTFHMIRKRRFDAALAIQPHPYLYAADRVLLFNTNCELLSVVRTRLIDLPIFLLAVGIGEILAYITLPFVLLKSLQYKKHQNRRVPQVLSKNANKKTKPLTETAEPQMLKIQ